MRTPFVPTTGMRHCGVEGLAELSRIQIAVLTVVPVVTHIITFRMLNTRFLKILEAGKLSGTDHYITVLNRVLLQNRPFWSLLNFKITGKGTL